MLHLYSEGNLLALTNELRHLHFLTALALLKMHHGFVRAVQNLRFQE